MEGEFANYDRPPMQRLRIQYYPNGKPPKVTMNTYWLILTEDWPHPLQTMISVVLRQHALAERHNPAWYQRSILPTSRRRKSYLESSLSFITGGECCKHLVALLQSFHVLTNILHHACTVIAKYDGPGGDVYAIVPLLM